MLEVRNLMVFFENALVVNDYSMDVKEGEIRGVIGSNSAGKTTLMNALSGLLVDRRTKERRRGGERITVMGSIRYLGEEVLERKPADRVKLGVVLCRERHPVFPESDVLENIRIAGYLRSRPEVRETIDFAFGLFPNLKTHCGKRAGFLSGGEQQMLAIAMALAARPRLLLLDEPLLGLSPLMQRHVVESVVRIRDELGVTTVIAEQFARPILPLLDYAYVIENGMTALAGTGPELMENPEVKAAYFGV
ncbi:MAG: ATP-binding cassette domain-containing protein [Deltaproteobacteria bacterium]|nr:ATP-binding cassette domain-containing protein [Deltaproteobacteria bacterium]